ncbi:MAG: S-layer homology domain-containing protein [Firmicutes bacterium]|nr:S-layer homology domain-containing protein [Bacillota bacterium]
MRKILTALLTLMISLGLCMLGSISNKAYAISDSTGQTISASGVFMAGAAIFDSGAGPYNGSFMVIKADGSLWGWGDNGNAQVLLNGTTTDSSVPVKIMDGVVSVSTNESGHFVMAIKTDGSLLSWGINNCGQLGNGTTAFFSTPIKIMDNVASVSTGDGFAMAVKTDGSLWGWGNNPDGQLGNGTTTGSNTPVKIMDGVASVSAGFDRTVAVKTDGSLWAWGRSRLGNGMTTGSSTPVKIMDNVASVSAGDGYTMAIKTDGSLWCWGYNGEGELGNGTTTDTNVPIKIMDDVTSVSAARGYTMAIKTDGSLWGWGFNDDGQLGDGTTTDTSTPVKILDNVASVSAGSYVTMALRTDGSIWTWGGSTAGCTLGNGTTTGSVTPVKIMDGAKLPNGYVYSQPNPGTDNTSNLNPITQPSNSMFTDVHTGDWFYNDVQYVYDNKLMTGTGETLFSPEISTTRGMIVTILYRQAGSPSVSGLENQFSDIAAGQWYTDAVTWAAKNNIVSGYGNNKFGPADNITREQLASILYRYEQFSGHTPSNTMADKQFADSNKISDYAKIPVNSLMIQGILSGKPGNLFDPQGMATRAEVAAMLHRFARLVH